MKFDCEDSTNTEGMSTTEKVGIRIRFICIVQIMEECITLKN